MAWKRTYTTREGKRYAISYRDKTGKVITKGGFMRSKDADAYKLDVERREQLGILYTEKPETFGEFVGLSIKDGKVVISDDTPETWYGRYKQTISQSSYKARRGVASHLAELIPLYFEQISPKLVEDLYMRVGFDKPRTAIKLSQTIKMILRNAKVRGQRINDDAISVKAPRYTPGDRRFLTHSEVDKLVEAAEDGDPQLANLIRFMALTGLRIHEALLLQDGDVLAAIVVGKSKTAAGRRSIPHTDATRALVARQKLARAKGSEYLFPSPTGKQAHLSHTSAKLVAARERAGMLDVTFHALRHTFATNLVAANVHPKQAAELMGHKDGGALFLRTYGHLYPNAAEAAMAQVAAHLAGVAATPLLHESQIKS